MLTIMLYSMFSSSAMRGVVQRGIGVERGVVRGVATGEAIRLNVVGLMTPLMAFTGLRLGYGNICYRSTNTQAVNTCTLQQQHSY